MREKILEKTNEKFREKMYHKFLDTEKCVCVKNINIILELWLVRVVKFWIRIGEYYRFELKFTKWKKNYLSRTKLNQIRIKIEFF